MWRFHKDFYVCYKISVNFGHSLQGKHKDYTNILCDLEAQNVVKTTDILYGLCNLRKCARLQTL